DWVESVTHHSSDLALFRKELGIDELTDCDRSRSLSEVIGGDQSVSLTSAKARLEPHHSVLGPPDMTALAGKPPESRSEEVSKTLGRIRDGEELGRIAIHRILLGR